MFRAILITLAVGFALLASWFAARGLFVRWTDNGLLYARVLLPSKHGLPRLEEVEQSSYMIAWSNASRQLQIRVFASNQFISTIAFSVDADHIDLKWEHAFSHWERLRKFVGFEKRYGEREIVGFTPPLSILPFARDINMSVPRGSLGPWIKLVLEEGLHAANAELDKDESEALANKILIDVMRELEIDPLNKRLAFIAFALGPCQFATLWLFFFSVSMFVIGIFQSWGRNFAEASTELLPYFGFFGTLLGMSGALRILGDADLSDSVSKAINLGPIGSQLGMAIETTKFALILYVAATMLGLLIAAIRQKPTAASHS